MGNRVSARSGKIIIAEDYQAMSKMAAQMVIKQIKKKPGSVLGLPTGSTPIGLYENLARAVALKSVSFGRAKAFILDEYAGLSRADSRSFHYFIKEKLFDRIDIKKENTFTPDGQAKDLKAECVKYENSIKKCRGIDLLILGIGLNGHVAFDEPGSEFNSKVRLVKITELTRRSNAKFFASLNQVPRQAITLGLGTIRQARKIILLANGEEKAKIMKRVLTGKITKSAPASVLRTHKNFTVILDRGAARELMRRSIK